MPCPWEAGAGGSQEVVPAGAAASTLGQMDVLTKTSHCTKSVVLAGQDIKIFP